MIYIYKGLSDNEILKIKNDLVDSRLNKEIRDIIFHLGNEYDIFITQIHKYRNVQGYSNNNVFSKHAYFCAVDILPIKFIQDKSEFFRGNIKLNEKFCKEMNEKFNNLKFIFHTVNGIFGFHIHIETKDTHILEPVIL